MKNGSAMSGTRKMPTPPRCKPALRLVLGRRATRRRNWKLSCNVAVMPMTACSIDHSQTVFGKHWLADLGLADLGLADLGEIKC